MSTTLTSPYASSNSITHRKTQLTQWTHANTLLYPYWTTNWTSISSNHSYRMATWAISCLGPITVEFLRWCPTSWFSPCCDSIIFYRGKSLIEPRYHWYVVSIRLWGVLMVGYWHIWGDGQVGWIWFDRFVQFLGCFSWWDDDCGFWSPVKRLIVIYFESPIWHQSVYVVCGWIIWWTFLWTQQHLWKD